MAVIDDTPIVAWGTEQSLLPGDQVKSKGWVILLALIVVALSVFGLSITCFRFLAQADSFEEPSAQELYHKVQAGQGPVVLRFVAQVAEWRGGWTPAPGDIIVYEPDLRPTQRAGMRMVDDLPVRCTDPRLIHTNDIDVETCIAEYRAVERQLLFGPSTFSNPLENGDITPRKTLDDVLTTYIEEVGHSWQEYFYETEGRGQGERTRTTSAEAEHKWMHGIEYQAKMYILNLDGKLLSLSNEQKHEFKEAICIDDGYANPMGHPVPSYGPPPDWPNPEGWPTAAPTTEEFQLFCDESGT